MTGRLLSEETFGHCKEHANGRLLEWTGDGMSWSSKAWIFSVPLSSVDGKEAFLREVVTPVVALVKLDAQPEAALEGTSAIPFAFPTPSG